MKLKLRLEDLEVFHGRNFPKQGWDLKADGGHVKLAPTQKGEQGGYRWEIQTDT